MFLLNIWTPKSNYWHNYGYAFVKQTFVFLFHNKTNKKTFVVSKQIICRKNEHLLSVSQNFQVPSLDTVAILQQGVYSKASINGISSHTHTNHERVKSTSMCHYQYYYDLASYGVQEMSSTIYRHLSELNNHGLVTGTSRWRNQNGGCLPSGQSAQTHAQLLGSFQSCRNKSPRL